MLMKVSATTPSGIVLRQFLVDCPDGHDSVFAINKIERANAKAAVEVGKTLFPTSCLLTAEPIVCTEDYCEI